MAKFNAQGIDGLLLSMEAFAALPDEVVEDILDAGATPVVAEQKRVLKSMGLYKSHKLHDSIQGFHKVGKRDGEHKRYVLIYPYGVRGQYMSRLQHKFGYATKFRAGRKYTTGGKRVNVTNNDVGFIYEFGAPKRGIKPRNWMKKANINAEESMVQAEFAVYDRFLKSKDL